jgi:subtilisin-like proprotein convertase family protein
LSIADTGLLLAIVRAESGFNPDAAAGPSSAIGIGQFTVATGKDYGLSASDKFDLSAQATATVNYFIACLEKAQSLGLGDSQVYLFYHDGLYSTGVNIDTLDIYNQKIANRTGEFVDYLDSGSFGLPSEGHITAPQILTDNLDGTTTIAGVDSDGNAFTHTYNTDGTSVLVTNSSTGTSTQFLDIDGSVISQNNISLTGGDALTLLSSVITVSGADSVEPLLNGGYKLTAQDGTEFILTPEFGQSLRQYLLTSIDGRVNISIDPNAVNDLVLGNASLTIGTVDGVTALLSTLNNSGTLSFGSTQIPISAGSPLLIQGNTIGVGSSSSDGLGKDYNFDPSGQLNSTTTGFLDFTPGDSLAVTGILAAGLLASANIAVGLDTPTGTVTNAWLTGIDVANLGALPLGSLPFTSDPTGQVQNGLVIGGPDVQVTFPTVNDSGLISNAAAGDVAGYYQPGNQFLLSDSEDIDSLLGGFMDATDQLSDDVASLTYGAPLGDYSNAAPSLADTDPLLIDLTGNGISLSNWISNEVYFQAKASNTGTASNPVWTSDGKQHHTSWANPGTGIVVFDPSGGAITDITQTLSEYFNGGSTPGKYADGLAALAGLAQAGATSFSAATASIDPATGQSYWNEVKIWNDANQNAVVDAGELETLSAAGITSISLQGSGNLGESINGSAVTDRTSYTTAGGSVGQVAAVDFQADTTGDITITADGGVIINASAEGGPNTTNSFVAKSANGHSYVLSNGVLTDQTAGATLGSGFTAVLSTNQNDTITVAAGDTHDYWLGGGTGADTLTGGAGNTVFLINSKTIVHGGTGFNLAQVDDANAITVDLKTDKLQEVIGGAGDGTFNASGTTWNVFIQGGSGNNIIIGGAAHDALAGGTGNDMIEAGNGGSVIHAGSGNDVIYGGSGIGNDPTSNKPFSDVIYGGAGTDTVVLGTNNSLVYAGTGTMTLVGNVNKTVPGLGSQAAFSVLSLHGSYADYKLVHNSDGTYTITDSVAGRDGTVTFSNITALDFSDIAQISPTVAQGMPVNDQLSTAVAGQVTTNAAGQYVIAASTLLANDHDYSGKTLSIRELVDSNGNPIARGGSGTVNGGTAVLSADGTTITFTPNADFNGVYSFRYHVVDSVGATGITVLQSGTSNVAELTATVSIDTASQPTDPVFDKEWYLQAVDVLPVWKDYTGAGVSVGIFDPSGNVDFSNPDLAPNAGNSIKIDGTPGIEQIGTHATLVAGVLGASGDGEGAVGVAPDATLSSEAITAPGNDPTVSFNGSNLMDWSNYDVVNNSFQLSPPFFAHTLSTEATDTELDALANAVQSGRGGKGTIVVVAGGNSRATGQTTNDFLLANSPDEITVGGINAPSDLGSLQISGKPFSDAGYTILVSAPANNVTSDGVTYTNAFGQEFGADTQTTQGTSFAAPIVAGIVADMLQANPNLTYRDVQQILAESAIKVDPNDTNPFTAGSAAGTGWTYNSALNWNGGGLHYSADYGFGEVDARAAVRLAETWQTAPGDVSLNVLGTKTNVALSAGTFTDVSQNSVTGIGPDLEFVQIAVHLTNVTLKNLTITLTSPSGNKSILLSKPNYDDSVDASPIADWQYVFGTQLDRGELYSGGWTLTITDASGASSTAVLKNWALSFEGNLSASSGNGQTYIYTDEFAQLATDPKNGARSTLVGTGNADTINAAAVTTGSTIDLTAGSTDSLIAGRGLTIGSGAKITEVFGGDGDDTLIANTLNDTLQGGRGNDAYRLNSGFGQDVIVNGWSTNTGPSGQLILGPGLDPTNLWFTRSGNDLVVQVLGKTSKATISGWYANNYSQLQFLTLADGSQLTTAEVAALAAAGSAYQSANPTFTPQTATQLPSGYVANWPAVTVGTAGNDTLTGTVADNVFGGGTGSDTLIGSGGNDVYRLPSAGGAVVIRNGISSNPGPSGELALAGNLSLSKLWLTQSGNDLLIQIIGTTSSVRIANWFASGYAQLNALAFSDGTSISNATITALARQEQAYQTLVPGFNAAATQEQVNSAFLEALLQGGTVLGKEGEYPDGALPGVFVRAPSGQLTLWRSDGAGLPVTATPITSNGSPELIDAATSVVGTGVNFLGTGNSDIFLREGGGLLDVLDLNSSKQVVGSTTLTNNGGPLIIDSGASVIGTGVNLVGTGGHDLFTRSGTGQVIDWEFNAADALAYDEALTYQGAPFTIDLGTTVVGTGVNLTGAGLHDVFARTASGQIVAWDVNASGAVTYGLNLTYQGAPFTIDLGTTVVGTGVNLTGVGMHDVFARTASGQIVAWDVNASGAVTYGLNLTYQGTPFLIDLGTTVIGTGVNLTGIGIHDVFARTASGQVVAWDVNGSGAVTYGLNLTYQGAPLTIDLGTTVLGTGANFGGGDGHDVFYRLGTGQLGFWEIDSTGAIVAASPLTYQDRTPFTVDLSTTVIGTGVNLAGTGGRDVFVRTASGQVVAWEINGIGAVTYALNLTYQNSTPFTVDLGTTVIGTGVNLIGLSGHDVFARTAGGQVVAWEINGSGTVTYAQNLTYQGAPFTIDLGTTVVGTGVNLTGVGLHDVFARTASGQIVAWDVNASGAVTYGLNLTYQGAPFTIDLGTTVVGTGVNLTGGGMHDVFARTASGQLVAWDVNGSGAVTYGLSLTFQGTPLNIDLNTTVLGTGVNFGGGDGHDVFYRLSTGQLGFWEIDSTGATVVASPLTYQGAPLVIDLGTTVIGTGMNFGGMADRDVFYRSSTGQMGVWGFNSAGGLIYVAPLTYAGAALTEDNATTVIGTGANFAGTGDNDIVYRSATGQVGVLGFNSAGGLTYAQGLTYAGAALILDNATTVVGTGVNFGGTGGHDLFMRAANGQLDAWEFNSAGLATYAQPLIYQTPIILDNATTVVGTGLNFSGNGGHDLFIRSGNGQLTAWEFNSAGVLLSSAAMTYNGSPFGFNSPVTVVGTAQNIGGNDHDAFFRVGGGYLYFGQFNGAGVLTGGAYLYSGGTPIVIDNASTVIGTGVDSADGVKDFTLRAGNGQTGTYDLVGGAVPVGANVVRAPSDATGGAADSDLPPAPISGSTSTDHISEVSGVATTLESDGSRLIIGTGGDDALGGVGGVSTLIGNGGADTYQFSATDVRETIQNGLLTDAGKSGELDFTDDLSGTDLWFDQVDGSGTISANGDDLRIDVLGTNRSVTIDNWFSTDGSTNQLSEVKLMNSGLTIDSQLDALVQAMASFDASYTSSHAGAAFDPSKSSNAIATDSILLPAVQNAWHH